MDREKIIKEWEAVLSRDPLDASWDLIDDTLTLLKEQEIKGQISDVIHGMAKQFRRPVMCKDCKYWHESETKKGYGDCGQANGITLKEESWYCADFVRNEATK